MLNWLGCKRSLLSGKRGARISTEEQIQAQQRQTEKEREPNLREKRSASKPWLKLKVGLTKPNLPRSKAEGCLWKGSMVKERSGLLQSTQCLVTSKVRNLIISRRNLYQFLFVIPLFTFYIIKLAGGFRTLLTDRNRLIMTVGGATALAAGVYTTRLHLLIRYEMVLMLLMSHDRFVFDREGARVTWGYINRILGQPSLIRESSMGRFPLASSMSQLKNRITGGSCSRREKAA